MEDKAICACTLKLEDGKPIVECDDEESQLLALAAMQKHEVTVRVKARLEPELKVE